MTKDQHAIFKGQVRRAGYFSNYAFGQAAAAGQLPLIEAKALAHGLALKDNLFERGVIKFDNPLDIQAIEDGYKDYKAAHPEIFPTPGSFIHK